MLLASLLLIAAPAPAGEPATVVQKAPVSPNKIVCRSETELGSRIPRRVCQTQAEWEEMARQTQEDLANSRNDRAITPN